MEEKSFWRQDELIEAALDEFSAHSYQNASLNKIIKNAGISKGKFYYRFEDKKALYLFIFGIAGGAQAEFINKRMEGEDLKDKDIFEELKMQFKFSGEFAVANPKYYKFITLFLEESQINKDLKSPFEDESEIIFDEFIKRAIKNGNFSDRFPIDFTKRIMRYLFTNYFGIFNAEEDYELEKMLENANNFVDFLKYGIGNNRGF